MKLQSNYKIEQATSKDATRLVLQTVYINDGKAVATDGRMLAVVPCEHTPEENNKLVNASTLKAIRASQKNMSKLTGNITADLNGKISWTNDNMGENSEPLSELTFPNYKAAIPADDRETTKIRFDIDLLNRLVDAIGKFDDRKNAYVTLEMGKDGEPIKVKTSNDAYGILMPVKIL